MPIFGTRSCESLFESTEQVKFHLTFQSFGWLRTVVSSPRRSPALPAAAAASAVAANVRSASYRSLLAPAERTSVETSY